MSYGYSTNQFERAFKPITLQNWHSVPRKHAPFPKTAKGYSQHWANDEGHLLPGVPRSTECPFGNYQGTWEMPLKIPPYYPMYTGRSKKSQKKLLEWREKFDYKGFCDGIPKYPKEELAYQRDYRPEHPTPPNTTPAPEIDVDYLEAGVGGRPGFTPGPQGYRTDSNKSFLPPISSGGSRTSQASRMKQLSRAESQLSQKKARIRKANFYDRYTENCLFGLPAKPSVKESRLTNKARSRDNVKFC